MPPGGNEADYLVGAARPPDRSSTSSGWPAPRPIAINGERVTTSTAIIDIGGSVLVNSAYLAGPYQVSAIGPPDLFAQPVGLARASRSSSSTRRGSFGIGDLVGRARRRRHPGVRRLGEPPRVASRPVAVAVGARRPAHRAGSAQP